MKEEIFKLFESLFIFNKNKVNKHYFIREVFRSTSLKEIEVEQLFEDWIKSKSEDQQTT